MVIMKAHLPDDAAVVFNDFLFFTHLPDLSIGERLRPGRMDQAFKFVSTYLSFTRDQSEIEAFPVEGLITECFPEWDEYSRSCPLGEFSVRPDSAIFPFAVSFDLRV